MRKTTDYSLRLRQEINLRIPKFSGGSFGSSAATTNLYRKAERRTAFRPAFAKFLFVILCFVWMQPPPALAQLGSLIVSITSPQPGSTVSGTITASANVTIVGLLTVAGVQFRLDGANLGAEDTTAPYSVQWNTTSASNGSHTLSAVARDTLGVQYASDPITVTVFNDNIPPTVSITSPASGA